MLTQERLKELLVYDPETGDFRWKVDRSGFVKAGSVAGTLKADGYRYIRLDYQGYMTGRLAFLYMIGEWPKDCVDHVNRKRGDDRWANLREATTSQNNSNRTMQANNTSGYRGVSWDVTQGKWDVRVNRRHIGWYDYLDEAIEARDEAALAIQGEFAILNQTGDVA